MSAKFVVFTGAGCSAESGIPTFRDSGGLWDKYDIAEVCNIHSFNRNLDKVYEFYNMLKTEYADAKYNPAHLALAQLQSLHGVENFEIYTSNVDLLLEQAGCKNVVHVHGDMEHLSCVYCFHRKHIGDQPFQYQTCEKCGGAMKPGVVFFGEQAPMYMNLINAFDPYNEDMEPVAVNRIVIGTSFQVIGTDVLCPQGLGSSLLIDPNVNEKHGFTNVIKMKAAESVDLLRGWVSQR